MVAICEMGTDISAQPEGQKAGIRGTAGARIILFYCLPFCLTKKEDLSFKFLSFPFYAYCIVLLYHLSLVSH